MTGPIVDINGSATADGAAWQMDPTQSEQIVINLVANARDAVSAGGRIRVQLDLIAIAPDAPSVSLEPGDCVRLLVADTGTGMSPELSAHIFEPFFTTKESGRGTSFEVLLPAA